MFKLAAGALAAVAAFAVATAAQAQPAPDAWVTPELQQLVQPSNAARLEALKRILEARGLKYEVVPFQGGEKGKPQEGRNVFVLIGDGPREIVVGAHYDAVTLKDGRMVEGVLDNGASVVALVDAAQELQRRGGLKHRVRIAFWDQEELGLVGAFKWLEQTDRSRIAASVNFDVNGYGDTLIYGGMKDGQNPAVHRALLQVCAARMMDCMRFPQYAPSDDIPFNRAGVPVVSIAFQPSVDAHQMWLALNGGKQSGLAAGFVPPVFTRIHSAEDQMGRVEPATVERASQVAVDMVTTLDAALASN